MKKFTLLFSILFLLAFVTKSFAAEIKLIDNSTINEKLITVFVDSKDQPTENTKVVLQASQDVTITEIRESEILCATFSSAPNANVAEIICTISSAQSINGKLAEVVFTTTSDSYAFAIDKTQSQIGELTIDNVVNIGELQLKDATTNGDTTGEEGTTEDVETNQEGTTTETETTPTTKKTTGFMSFLPYILLGAAGIFLLTIVVLVLTKKKDDITPDGLQNQTQFPQEAVVPSLITPQVMQPQVENMPTNIPTVEVKPTLEQLVSQSPEVQNSMPPIEPTPQILSSRKDEISDLEALLVSENPSMNTIPQEPVVPAPVEQVSPIIDTVQNIPQSENADLTSGYTANISTGGLPEVGSTSPLEPSYQTSPNLGPIEQSTAESTISEIPVIDITSPNPLQETNQKDMGMEMPITSPLNGIFPVENTLPQVDPAPSLEQPVVNPVQQTTTETIDGDLQNLVNQEISSIPVIPTPANTEPQNPATPMNPI